MSTENKTPSRVNQTVGKAAYLDSGASISQCGAYRYRLWRIWDRDLPRVCFVMLNPSTADAQQDDPTIRKCVGYAKRWGYGSLVVVNLYAFRATDPKKLKGQYNAIGTGNQSAQSVAFGQSKTIVYAWGQNKGDDHYTARVRMSDTAVRHGVKPVCLGKNKDRSPKHPLYLKNEVTPVAY